MHVCVLQMAANKRHTSCQDADVDADPDADGCLCPRNIVANCTETTTMHSITRGSLRRGIELLELPLHRLPKVIED